MLAEVDFTANSPMRLGINIFLMIYLIFMIWNLIRAKKMLSLPGAKKYYWMIFAGIIALVCGDSIHEIYLMISYIQNDIWLNGFGFTAMMLTSIFMTTYYLGLFLFQLKQFPNLTTQKLKIFTGSLFLFYIIRIVLATLPENKYADTTVIYPTTIHILSNVFFALFGFGVLISLYTNSNTLDPATSRFFKISSLWGFASFVFYILHLTLYPINNIFGMFMLPKSLAYMAEVYYIVKGLGTLIAPPTK